MPRQADQKALSDVVDFPQDGVEKSIIRIEPVGVAFDVIFHGIKRRCGLAAPDLQLVFSWGGFADFPGNETFQLGKAAGSE